MQIGQLDSGFVGQRVLRIKPQKLLKCRPGTLAVVQVAQINLALGEQRAETIAAAGIGLAQKLVLADCIAQGLLILKDPPFLGQQIRHRRNRCIGFG